MGRTRFIERMVDLFEELYIAPKRAGVKGIRAEKLERQALHNALKHLTSLSARVKSGKVVGPLIERLTSMGKVLGFNAKGYIPDKEYHQYGQTNLRGPLPNVEERPFFVWRLPEYFPYALMDFKTEIFDFGDRAIGPIFDPRRTRSTPDGSVIYKDKEAMISHGMEIVKSRQLLPENADTRLKVQYGWDLMGEGWERTFCIDFKDGEIVDAHVELLEHLGAFEVGDTKQVLDAIVKYSGIPTEQFLYYILASNLSEQHRRDIGILANPEEQRNLIVDGKLPVDYQKAADSTNDRETDLETSLARRVASAIATGITSRLRGSRNGYLLASDSVVDLDTLTPTYNRVDYKDLTVDELLAASFDRYRIVEIEFRSEKGNKYLLIYVKPNGYVELCGCDKDYDDFIEVRSQIANGLKMSARGDVREDSIHPYEAILGKSRRDLSIKSIRNAASGFVANTFSNVRVASLEIMDVTERDLERFGLPASKAEYLDCVLK